MISWWANDKWLGKKDLAIALMFASRFGSDIRVMEVGLWKGGWALHLAMNRGVSQITAIDPYPGLDAIRDETNRRFEALGIDLNLYGSWLTCGTDSQFDLIHVDGEHSESAALNDLYESASRLSPGGAIIVDDWLQPQYIGVNSAVHRFLSAENFRVVLTTEWKAYLTPAEEAPGWHEYLVAQLNELGRIAFEVDQPKGLGEYLEARTVLGAPVIVALGKPLDVLTDDETNTDGAVWVAKVWLLMKQAILKFLPQH